MVRTIASINQFILPSFFLLTLILHALSSSTRVDEIIENVSRKRNKKKRRLESTLRYTISDFW